MNINDKLSLSLESHDNLMNTVEAALHTLTRGLCITDIALGMGAMDRMGRQTAHYVYAAVNEETLVGINKLRHQHKASFMKIYPIDAEPLNITDFSGDDVKRLMNIAHQKCDVELYLYD